MSKGPGPQNVELASSIEKQVKLAFTNPFDEIEVPDLNNLPAVEILWQRTTQSWPVPTIDPCIDRREIVLEINGRAYLWKRAWWNRTKASAGMVLYNSITGLPIELARRIGGGEKPDSGDMQRELAVDQLEHLWIAARLAALCRELSESRPPYQEDILHDLGEISTCVRHGSHRACLALTGRCLEVVLKVGLQLRGHEYQQDWMVGRLLTEYADCGIYLDPTLKNIFNILNIHRVSSVHCKKVAEIPSLEQALSMVILLIDTIKRCLLKPV